MNQPAATALVLIYNHRFEANIDRLETIYSGRFSRLVHVVPFYRGSRENVLTVYESSHHFAGFFAQAYARLSALQADHYIVCGDDVILNPGINEGNVTSILRLGANCAYIKAIRSIADVPLRWPHAAGALASLVRNTGVEWSREIPSAEAAEAAFLAHGVSRGHFSVRQLRHGLGPKQTVKLAFYFLKRLARKWNGDSSRLAEFPYPLANAYSDFFTVPRGSVAEFCHLCGVFAAMDLFVEVAIPTALLLSCGRIVQEKDIGWRGHEIWARDQIEQFGSAVNFDLQRAFAEFPPDRLYVHPIKLSRWSLG